jgi:hypothetical protein
MNVVVWLISLLFKLWGWRCGCENTSRAWRGEDGRDYVVCLECGKRWVSRIQFD